jgi:hypothetical protein
MQNCFRNSERIVALSSKVHSLCLCLVFLAVKAFGLLLLFRLFSLIWWLLLLLALLVPQTIIFPLMLMRILLLVSYYGFCLCSCSSYFADSSDSASLQITGGIAGSPCRICDGAFLEVLSAFDLASTEAAAISPVQLCSARSRIVCLLRILITLCLIGLPSLNCNQAPGLLCFASQKASPPPRLTFHHRKQGYGSPVLVPRGFGRPRLDPLVLLDIQSSPGS